LWVLVGLGNPGKRYSATRHNAGFMLVQRIAERHNVGLRKRSFSAKAAQVMLGSTPVLLVCPWTYMNRSGKAVKELIRRTGVKPECLLVAYDDLDLSLGKIRIRKAGGPGTHNGMISVVQEIDSTKFPRIRIGIGPLAPGADAADFVLADFQEGEKPILEDCLAKAEDAVELIVSDGIEIAMNRFNSKGDNAKKGNSG